MIDYPVTFFSSPRSSVSVVVSLQSVLSDFRNGKYSYEISRVRRVLETSGEDAYREAKKALPAIAFCGEFNGGHGKNNLVFHNNLLIFDIDHLNKEGMAMVRNCLSKADYILAFWVSPSGNGYKGLVRIEYHNIPKYVDLDTCYKKAFLEIQSYLEISYSIHLDSACSDYSRICYVCWDKNLFFNPEARVFPVDCSDSFSLKKKPSKQIVNDVAKKAINRKKEFHPINMKGKNDPRSRKIVGSIIKYLSKRNLSITSTYEEWLRVGFAIASTFNYDLGLKYYLEFCKLDGIKYDEQKSVEKLQECYMHGTGEIKLGTIIEMAQKKGYQYKGSSEDS